MCPLGGVLLVRRLRNRERESRGVLRVCPLVAHDVEQSRLGTAGVCLTGVC